MKLRFQALAVALIAVGSDAGSSPHYELVADPELKQVVADDMQLIDGVLVRWPSLVYTTRPFEIEVPVGEKDVLVTFWLHSVRADDYCVKVYGPDGSWTLAEPSPVQTLRGSVAGYEDAQVTGSFRNGGIAASIRLPGHSVWHIEPVTDRTASRPLHVVFASEQVVAETPICFTPENRGTQPAQGRTGCSPVVVAQLGCDADYEYFVRHNRNIFDVEARINAVVNAVNPEYEKETCITHEITTVIVRTAETDPYQETNVNAMVFEMQLEWENNQDLVSRDLAILFSGKNEGGGRALDLEEICTHRAYCVVSDDTELLACESGLVAHEIGHLWGGEHCTPCPNMMNAPAPCSIVMSSGTRDIIIAYRNSRDCLSSPEDAPTVAAMPFSDSFSSPTINTDLWTGIERATVSDLASNPPSAPYSLRINGAVRIRSARMDTSTAGQVTVSYNWKRAGQGDIPEVYNDLIVEYFANPGGWQVLAIHPGNGLADTLFTQESFCLPGSANHDGFRIGFRNTSSILEMDDFYVDDVSVTSAQLPPDEVSLLAPADLEQDVSTEPTWEWAASCGGAVYRLLVATSDEFANPIVDVETPETSFHALSSLASGTSYCWKIEATNPVGTTSSDVGVFSTPGYTAPACSGDATGDRRVDFADLNLVLTNWGMTTSEGDVFPEPAGDGVVNISDMEHVLANFGNVCH